MIEFKKATIDDFDEAFKYIQLLLESRVLDKKSCRPVYEEIIENEERCFAFFAYEDGRFHGFCHGDYIGSFWKIPVNCYISGLIVDEEDRGMGYGRAMMDHALSLAKEKGCTGAFLVSGNSRKNAHKFYNLYGYEPGCIGFDIDI